MEKRENKLKNTLQFNKIDLNNIQEGNGDFNFGDIIYGKRYANNQEKRKLPIDHRNGYFLVLRQDNKDVYCLYGTSEVPAADNSYSYFKIKGDTYNLEKDIYFSFFQTCLLKEHLVLNKEGKLKEYDRLKLIRQMVKCMIKEDEISCGDVIRYSGKQYLVLSKDLENYGVLPMGTQGKTNIFFDNKDYYTSLHNFRLIPKDGNFIKVGTVDSQVLQVVRDLMEKYQRESALRKSIHLGSVVQNESFYYIYGETEEFYRAFKLVSKDFREDGQNVVVDGKKFKALFEDMIRVPKGSKDFKPKYAATDEEMVAMNNLMQTSKDVTKLESIADLYASDEADYDYGLLGYVVTYTKDNKDYIVLAKDQEICLLLDLNKYFEGNLYVVEANYHDIKKRKHLSKENFLEMLNTMSDTYSSYMTRSYIPNLIKKYED